MQNDGTKADLENQVRRLDEDEVRAVSYMMTLAARRTREKMALWCRRRPTQAELLDAIQTIRAAEEWAVELGLCPPDRRDQGMIRVQGMIEPLEQEAAPCYDP